jgi:ribosomal protein L20A (L18A)
MTLIELVYKFFADRKGLKRLSFQIRDDKITKQEVYEDELPEDK